MLIWVLTVHVIFSTWSCCFHGLMLDLIILLSSHGWIPLPSSTLQHTLYILCSDNMRVKRPQAAMHFVLNLQITLLGVLHNTSTLFFLSFPSWSPCTLTLTCYLYSISTKQDIDKLNQVGKWNTIVCVFYWSNGSQWESFYLVLWPGRNSSQFLPHRKILVGSIVLIAL